jgi:hypothetical protein
MVEAYREWHFKFWLLRGLSKALLEAQSFQVAAMNLSD